MEYCKFRNMLADSVRRFGRDGISADEVMLCENHEDIIKMFISKGFNRFVNGTIMSVADFELNFPNELLKKYRIYTSGKHKLYGSHTSYLLGDAEAEAYNNHVVYAYNQSRLSTFTYARGFIHDECIGFANQESRLDSMDDGCTAHYNETAVGTINAGKAFIRNKAMVRCLGGTIDITDCADMQILCSGKDILVTASGCAKIHACGCPKIEAYENAEIIAHDFSKVSCYGKSKAELHDKCMGDVHEEANVVAHDSVILHIYGGNNIKMVGSSVGLNYMTCKTDIDLWEDAYLMDFNDNYNCPNGNACIKWSDGKIFSKHLVV